MVVSQEPTVRETAKDNPDLASGLKLDSQLSKLPL
jgi:hypothetical protein